MKMKKKALVMLSGGLDSILTVRVLKEQGIDVEVVHFVMSFGGCAKKEEGYDRMADIASKLGVKLHRFDVSEEFLNVVKDPKYGYGNNVNPCVDCKIFMLKKAKQLMKEIGAAVVATGEVLGQRPMSQHRGALKNIEIDSGLEGYLLRPLCAKHMKQTIPEKEGIIDRERLLNFHGRSRKPQMALAKEFGIDFYPSPAGGCLLTDPGYTSRLKDAMERGDINLEIVSLLKVGRHFRLSNNARLMVGRNEKENNQLNDFCRDGDVLLEPLNIPGPTGLVKGEVSEEDFRICASIIARYCSKAPMEGVDLKIATSDGAVKKIHAEKIDDNELQKLII